MFYYFKDPDVYRYFDFITCKESAKARSVGLEIDFGKKDIIKSYLSCEDFFDDGKVLYIKPNRPLFIDYRCFNLVCNDYGFCFDSGRFDLDFFSLNDGFFVCSKRFKDFLGKFDSNVHSFWKLEVQGVDIEYYLMFVGRIVIFDKDRVERYDDFLEDFYCSYDDKNLIDDLPVWTLKNEHYGIFFSDYSREK